MLSVSDLALAFNGQNLFSDVNLIFQPGSCYGVIGANGAGKSTFLKILCGTLEPSRGAVVKDPKSRMSVLQQNHYAYEEFTALETILQGNPRLYEVLQQKDELYNKPDFSEEDGNLAAELEAEFAELGGWDAETDAGRLLQGLGLDNNALYSKMSALPEKEKVKVLLARALFGSPDILLMDEPTNGLDVRAVSWLEDFLLEYEGTVIVVSHDRHFLNNVCTHIVDIDFTKIRMYVGNYDFWYESSLMMQRLQNDQKKKAEEKIAELQSFIQRFSANKSKSKQATSRKKLLDKLTVEEMPASSRKYPYVSFVMDREPGKEILEVEGLCKSVDGVEVLRDVSFRLTKTDKAAFVGDNDLAGATLLRILAGELEPDAGSYKWGISTSRSYFPADNSAYFEGSELNILEWLQQYSSDPHETYLRGFLGKMLFSGEDVYKQVRVLSGGEKVRCMLSRMMLYGSNVLLLDQPTNHLDLESITAVNNGLIAFKGVVLFVSHDHEFMQTVANRVIELLPEGCKNYDCTYDEYLERRK